MGAQPHMASNVLSAPVRENLCAPKHFAEFLSDLRAWEVRISPDSHSLSLSRSPSLTHTLSLTHAHSLYLSHTLSLSLSLSHTLSYTLARTLSEFLSDLRAWEVPAAFPSGLYGWEVPSICELVSPWLTIHFYVTESVYKVVSQKSIFARICPLVLYISNNKGYVDGFVRDSPSRWVPRS